MSCSRTLSPFARLSQHADMCFAGSNDGGRGPDLSGELRGLLDFVDGPKLATSAEAVADLYYCIQEAAAVRRSPLVRSASAAGASWADGAEM